MAKVTIKKKDIIASAPNKASNSTTTPNTNSGTDKTSTDSTTKSNNGNGGGSGTNNGNSNNVGGTLNMTLVNKIKSINPGKLVPTNGQLQPLYLNSDDNSLPAMFRANMDNDESFSYEGAHIVPGTTMPTFVRVDVNNESLTHIITPFDDGDIL